MSSEIIHWPHVADQTSGWRIQTHAIPVQQHEIWPDKHQEKLHVSKFKKTNMFTFVQSFSQSSPTTRLQIFKMSVFFFFLIYTYHYILSGEMKHTYSNWQTAFTWNYTHPPKKTCSEKEQEETEKKKKKKKCSRTSESEGKDVSAWVSFSIWKRKGDIVQKANTIQRRR